MDINLTLFVQMLVFGAFVWFTMKFVWPPLVNAMEERQAKIADGLAAAERGRKEFELAQQRAKDEIKTAREQTIVLLERAKLQGVAIIDEAKEKAKLEVDRQSVIAREQLKTEMAQAKESLVKEVSALALACAKKILQKEINEKDHAALIDSLLTEIQ